MNPKNHAQAILAAVVVVGFFLALMYVIGNANLRDVLLVLVGQLSAAFAAVIAYYFGSTSSSARKDVLLANAVPPEEKP